MEGAAPGRGVGRPAWQPEQQGSSYCAIHIRRISVTVIKLAYTSGLLQDSAAAWVLNLPHQSLAFLLHDAGYDVWLGSVRGSTWGLEHSRLDPSSDAFWQFTYDDMASHDLPAMCEQPPKPGTSQTPRPCQALTQGLSTTLLVCLGLLRLVECTSLEHDRARADSGGQAER